MNRPLTRDRNGILRDPFGRAFTYDPEAVQRARRVADYNRTACVTKRRSSPRPPYVKIVTP